jgi:uncharacterized protein with GYD domain
MARAVVLLKLTREGAMNIEQARAIYEETKLFASPVPVTGLSISRPPSASTTSCRFVEVPDQNAIQPFFRRGILAAAHGSFQVCTLPALPFEEFVKVVDGIRPSEPPTTGVNE